LTLKEWSFKIDGRSHLIRELDGDDRAKYLDSVSSRVKINNQGKPIGMTTFKGLETGLLKLCLYEDDALVPEKTMAKWPSSLLSRLFDVASDLSGLNEAAKKRLQEEAKNG
jgi:hypothetical protein